MPKTVEEIAAEALILSSEDQALLADRLAASLDSPATTRRRDEVRIEAIQTNSGGEALASPNGIHTAGTKQPSDAARAGRFAVVSIVLGLSCLSLKCSFSIGIFESIYLDMLGDKPLPVLTQFILSARILFVAASILVPIFAAATLFMRSAIISFYILGGLGIVTILQSIVLSYGLFAPLMRIFRSMSAGSTP